MKYKKTIKPTTNNQIAYDEWQNKKLFCLNYINPILLKDYTYHTLQTHNIQQAKNNYDCLINLIDKEGQPIKSLMIKLKIRSSIDNIDGLFLQKTTVDKMIKVAFQDHIELIYINVLPTGTYKWSLNDLEPLWVKRDMSSKTLDVNSPKTKKKVHLLNLSDAKFIDYVFNEIDYKRIKEYKPEVIEKKKIIGFTI